MAKKLRRTFLVEAVNENGTVEYEKKFPSVKQALRSIPEGGKVWQMPNADIKGWIPQMWVEMPDGSYYNIYRKA